MGVNAQRPKERKETKMIEIVNEAVDVETSDINYGTVGHCDSVMFCD